MSRGLSTKQVEILACLASGGWSTPELASRTAGDMDPHAARSTTRRALRSLERRGLVCERRNARQHTWELTPAGEAEAPEPVEPGVQQLMAQLERLSLEMVANGEDTAIEEEAYDAAMGALRGAIDADSLGEFLEAELVKGNGNPYTVAEALLKVFDVTRR